MTRDPAPIFDHAQGAAGQAGERRLRNVVEEMALAAAVPLRAQSTRRIVATVLANNERMLSLARELGFAVERAVDGVHAVGLTLQATDEPGGR